MCGSCQREIDQRFIFTFLHLSFSIIELQVLFISFFFIIEHLNSTYCQKENKTIKARASSHTTFKLY